MLSPPALCIPYVVKSDVVAPASSSGDIKALAASMEAMRSLLEETRDEARENARETTKGLSALGERQATTEERLRAVANAQETTARTVTNGYREHSREALAARESAELVRQEFDGFRKEVQARFERVEQGVSAVVPAVADATATAAVPWRNKVAKTARQSWWMGALVVAMAVGKFFIPSAAALGTDWHIFVRSVNGVDKTLSAPQN